MSAAPVGSFFDTFDCRSGSHCRTCRNREGGVVFRENIATYFKLPLANWDCPHGRPWDIADPPAPLPILAGPASVPAPPPARAVNPTDDISAEEAKRRFIICRTCEHSRDDAFACALHPGCCFGRFRTDLANDCPARKW
jgi:hypothetical protein